ncbi:hypothetical protein [Microbacterium aerolatum]|uniref:hypothetical protein n=1 Tax=Microbacterium aerolatum TaxID=153731 RepID=UPI003850D2C0
MSDGITLFIETDEGVRQRTIQPALPLPADVERGIAAEDAIRAAAAIWGMPDFVFEPAHETSGSGVREVGDGVLITSGTAVMIQSKSRHQSSELAEREANWLTKNITKGFKQGAGSIRFLSTRPVAMRNRRGRTVTIDGTALTWVSLVLVDHDEVPEGYVPSDLPPDAVVMLRRDWEFLFHQLRSTRSVVGYLRRVAGESIALGTEPVRYHELALEDLNVEPVPTPQWVTPGATLSSVPQAPLDAAGVNATVAHFVLRTIQEDVAQCTVPAEEESVRIDLLSRLDSIPVASRSDLGERLLAYMTEARTWSKRSLITSTRIYLPVAGDEFDSPIVFMIASRLDDMTEMVFRARVELQHHDFLSVSANDDLITIGVLLTPGTSSGREWDTTFIAARGPLDLEDEYVDFIREQLTNTLRG